MTEGQQSGVITMKLISKLQFHCVELWDVSLHHVQIPKKSKLMSFCRKKHDEKKKAHLSMTAYL